MTTLLNRVQIVLWKEDRPASREWIVENLKQASGILVMLTDKVGLNSEIIGYNLTN